ncbi:type I polyketide synthase [Rhizohabitans arisaemae]|uniref:type I polyketide synthase n=1 Tax=Rhizohabitans arisaemae TaxID=2720610 RepID=UPI0024B07836|nr:type I polyketide synthase [Rhizohabitans arisaemae]
MSAGLPAVLSHHAAAHPKQIAYRFLETGDLSGPIHELTFSDLQERVRAIASTLLREPHGARVILLHPPGLEFIAAFLACMQAGVIAVPVSSAARLPGIIADCGAGLVLGAEGMKPPESAGVDWIATDALTGGVPDVRVAGDVAFLQYTSGSTGSPKGVMVTHAGLMHNIGSQQAAWDQSRHSQFVSWLPHFHDMGLIGGLLYPLILGATTTLFSPLAFVQRPLRWLEAISRYRGTFSLAPNFAYDLCARKSSDAEAAGLDLSSWEIAGNGAEPVRAATLDRFTERFATAGFRREAFSPCYGLAEGTLFVTSVPKGEPPNGLSCGRPDPDTEIAVVDPDSRRRSELGEIWVKSQSNAVGYWNREAETRETFQARLHDGDGPYLRTGDLGFFRDGGLHIAGRIKDLIVVAGANHYPQDVEVTVEGAHPSVRAGCTAAFAVDDGVAERLVVVAELNDAFTGDASTVVAALRRAIAEEHGLDAHAVSLVRARTIPKTSSGKIRRGECRTRFLGDGLTVRHAWRATQGTRTRKQIESWLIAQVALLADLDPREISIDRSFESYGLVSQDTVALSGDLGTWLGREVPPTALYEHPTVGLLARSLSAPKHPTSAKAAAPSAEPVAIVGIGCRYPGADGPTGYWSLLAGGTDAIRDVPESRWDATPYFQAGEPMPGKMYTRRGGFLGDVSGFDPAFFGISYGEARFMDPQQRLLLEIAWEAFEDAGIIPGQLAGSSTGVFVGITTSDYAQLQLLAGLNTGPYSGTGNVFCMASNRISYTFDLRGPSISLDTACSSSLVAVHQACMSLRTGEAELALAGGVNLMLSPQTTIALCQGGALSPDGRCHTFDDRANGYVRGEGVGLVVLKPLRRAIDDGDRIYAVIRGSAVNQDGASNGLTAPNPEAHARVINQAFANAGLSPQDLRYVEAHGTGTALGDPIEARALGAVLAGGHCAVGSVKTNIGHLEPAAGVAGLTKVALALHHERIPPNLNFDTPNRHIDLDALGLRVPTELGPWPAGSKIAGVNSFGVGGTNAHVVLQEAPVRRAAPTDDGRPHLFTLSARTPAALAALAERVVAFLPESSASLAHLCHTAALRRTRHEHRLAVTARSTAELAERLAHHRTWVTGRAAEEPRLVFVFPGQGSQYVGMARELLSFEPAFRSMFERCERAMRPYLDWSLQDQLNADEEASQLHRDEVVQSLLFAIQVSLAAMWRSWGVEPDAVVGHSMGEVAAAHIAGAITLDQAARLSCLRARELAVLHGQGAMAVVALSLDAVTAELTAYDGRLHVAAANGPSLSVVSGDADALQHLLDELGRRDVFCRMVRASGAGHSPVVDPAARAVAAEFADLRPSATAVPLYSTVTGGPVRGEELDGGYWGRNLRRTVLFHPAIERLAEDGYRLFLEISPNPVLTVPVQDALGDRGHAFGTLARKRDDREALLEAVGTLHVYGGRPDLRRLFTAEPPVTSLPSGPWQREHCWALDSPGAPIPARRAAAAPLSTEDAVAAAFAGVLRVPGVNPGDNFFELGGTSLMAAQMLYELRSNLAREIPLRLLFENPTIKGFTQALLDSTPSRGAETMELVRAESADHPLTMNQRRVLDEGRDLIVAQHLLLEGPLDVPALDHAVRRLFEVHEGLRTVFVDLDEPRQILADRPAAVLTLSDLDLPAWLKEVEDGFKPFEGPLYRFGLVKLAEDRHVLSVVLDHLITDGWSQGVLFQDLVQAYDARLAGRPDGLEPGTLRLVDYAHWERARYSGPHLDERMRYWRRKLRRTQAPDLRFVRTGAAAGEASVVTTAVEKAVCADLAEVTRTTATTMPIVVLAAFLLTLRHHSGQDRLAVPISASARERPDLERMLGFLSKSRLVAADFSGEPTRRECLVRVRDAVLEAAEEQGLSITQHYHLEGVPPADIPFRVSMNYLPAVDLPTRLGAAKITPLPRHGGYPLSRDLLLVVQETDGGLRLSFGYAAGAIATDDMERFAADMSAVLHAFVNDLDGTV